MIGAIAAHYVAAPAGGGYSAAVLADTPLAYWRLGDTSGTSAADSSGNARTGTYVNAPTKGVAGALTGDADTAVTFNGTNQTVTAPSTGLDAGSTFTAEAWVKGSLGTGERTIVGRWGSSWRWLIVIDDSSNGKPNAYVYDGGYPNTGAGTKSILDGSWHHVAITGDGTTLRLYIDGALDKSVAYNGAALGYPGLGLNIAAKGNNTSYFAGTIDEVAVYGTALSAARIAAHFNAR